MMLRAGADERGPMSLMYGPEKRETDRWWATGLKSLIAEERAGPGSENVEFRLKSRA